MAEKRTFTFTVNGEQQSVSAYPAARLLDVLRLDMPRSLHACTRGIVRVLEAIKNDQSAETERLAGILHAHIHYARIEDILKQGLHEYLTDFMDRIYELGEGISKDFLVPA